MKIVLHICCGVCATSVVERLILEGHEVLGLFYNPNIYPMQEYNKRLNVTYEVAKKLDFQLQVAPYEPEEWFREVAGFEKEPEGGQRCQICFRQRLKRAYLYMQGYGADAFTTTLTISPHKSADLINQIGREVGGDMFLVRDFKKEDGFKRATELSKKLQLYRQNYCGCLYSIKREKEND